jgi:UDP-N-acetylglucosamine 2-epimerase (non-hydrolysing)
MDPMTIALVVGARPNFMKAAPLLRLLRDRPAFAPTLIHTGQHYDHQMSGAFFRDLEMPAPDAYLGVGSGSQAEQTARVMVEFEKYLAGRPPDLVILFGDVNSTLACSVVAAKSGVRLAHVEAGLRSRDRSMPEEINRIVTDSISDIFFTTELDANDNLLAEGHSADAIHFVGNTMIDTLERHRAEVDDRAPLAAIDVPEGGYLLVTLHRPANVDDAAKLRQIIRALEDAPLPVVFPMHPRTRNVAEANRIPIRSPMVAIPPLGYIDFLRAQRHARLVVTDSGGIQEETSVLGVRCLTFRDNTERPVTITHGTNTLIGADPERLLPAIQTALAEKADRRATVPPLWDGRAAERIADVLEQI